MRPARNDAAVWPTGGDESASAIQAIPLNTGVELVMSRLEGGTPSAFRYEEPDDVVAVAIHLKGGAVFHMDGTKFTTRPGEVWAGGAPKNSASALNGERDAEQSIDSYAAFGEITAPIGDPRLRLTLGGRYTRDEKALDLVYTGSGFPGTVPLFEQEATASYDLWTGRAALSFQPTEEVNFYATVGRGAKSGGFPRFALAAALGLPSVPYAASTSWTFEAGSKLRFGNRFILDLAAFHNDVGDEQLFVLDFVSFQFVPANLDTRSYGLEVQGTAELGSGWSFAAGAAWQDAEIAEADVLSGASAGNRVPNVAEFSSTATLDFEGRPIGGVVPVFMLSHQYVGGRATDVAESFELPSYHHVDVRLGARIGQIEAYVFGRNLFDARQEINGVLYGPGVEAASLARGRVMGVGLAGSF